LATVGKKQDHFGENAEIQHRLRGNETFGIREIETTLGTNHFGGRRTGPAAEKKASWKQDVNELETTFRSRRR
jgi:hypothetical protein